MGNITTSQHTHTIRADGKPIVNELSVIENKIADLRKSQDTLTKGTKDWTATAREINQLSGEADKVRASMGTLGMTMGQLSKLQSELNAEFKKFGTGGDKLQEVNTRLAEMRSEVASTFRPIQESQGIWKNLGQWIAGAFTIGAIIEAGRAILGFTTDSVMQFRAFQKAAQELKGETGMTAEQLDKLKKSAKENGEQFGMSATDMLKAYNAIASGKSELIEIEGGIEKVTKAAIRLSINGGMSMEQAAKVVTESLNQYGKSAADAEKFVNSLSTGTKIGAGKIGEMSDALAKVGPTANSANISFATTNAALQLFAQNGIKGAEAGTQLKSMLAQMMKGASDTNPAIVGLEKAMENLRAKNMTATESMKFFGTEANSGGQILLKNTDTLKDWTKQIEIGSAGAEMFADKMNTDEQAVKQAEAVLNNMKITIGEKLSPAIRTIIAGFVEFTTWTKNLYNSNQPLVEVISSLFRTIGNLVKIVWDTVTAVTGMSTATERAQAYLTYLKVIFGVVATAAATLVGVIGLVIDGLRFLSGQINFDQLKSNATKNFSEIGKSLKSTFVDKPAEILPEAKAISGKLGKETTDKYHIEAAKSDDEHFTKKQLAEKQRQIWLANAKKAYLAQGYSDEMSQQKSQDEWARQNGEKTHAQKVTQTKKTNEQLLKAAQDLAKDELEVRKKLADASDKLWFDSIDDEWEKKRIAIIREFEKDWETQKNLVGNKKDLQEKFAQYEIDLAKKRDADLAKLAKEKSDKETKEITEKAQKEQEAIDNLIKGTKAAAADIDKAEKAMNAEKLKDAQEHAKRVAETHKEAFHAILGLVNQSFNDTISALEGIDTAYARSQAERIKGIQAGFQQVTSAVGAMKLDTSKIFDFVKGEGADGIGAQLGKNIAGALGNAFSANPVAFIGAAKKIIDGINGIFEANMKARIVEPFKKIIADAKDAIADLGEKMKLTIKGLEDEADAMHNRNDANRDKLTAAALDFEATQLGNLVKSKEELKTVNDNYSAEELRIKQLYASELNNTDKERAEKARIVVDGLLHDLKVKRNEDIESLINTQNSKRDIEADYAAELTKINLGIDTEITAIKSRSAEKQGEIAAKIAAINTKAAADAAEVNRTAATRTQAENDQLLLDIATAKDKEIAVLSAASTAIITEQTTLIDAQEVLRKLEIDKIANERTKALTALLSYKDQEALINKNADEAILNVKKNINNLTIDEQQRLIDEINGKRLKDLDNLATSDLGIAFIKEQTAAAIKKIEQGSAAETLRINGELKEKRVQAEADYNRQIYAQQLAAWEAERNQTIALLKLQLIKASGKIFNKSEMKAIEAALGEAMGAMPPPPPAGFFNVSSSGGNSQGGNAASSGGGGDAQGPASTPKYANGGQFFEPGNATIAKGLSYANGGYIPRGIGGLAQGPSHADGGIWLWNPNTGQKVGEMEGNEYIVNKESTAAHLGLLSQLNNRSSIDRLQNSSFARTGQPRYEDGGVFSTFAPITLNQSNSLAGDTLDILKSIAKATGVTADNTEATAKAADATARNTNTIIQPLNEAANNSRQLGNIAAATRDTANKNFSVNTSDIEAKLNALTVIRNSAVM